MILTNLKVDMGINIYLITQEQRDILINSDNDIIKFNPIQDINNNYLISENEFNLISNLDDCPVELEFIKTLVSSIYEPKIYNFER